MRTLTIARSIRGRILLLTLAVVIPASLVAGWLIYESHRNQRRVVERQLSETAKALSLVVDRQLGQSEALLRALATSPSLQSGDLPAFAEQARRLVHGGDRWIILNAPDGQQTVNTFLPESARLPKVEPPLEYAPNLRMGQTHVSDLFPSKVRGADIVSVVVPVIQDGTFQSALAMGMLPSTFSDVLADQRLPLNWVAAIIDRNGKILARNRGGLEFVGKPATPDIVAAMRTHDRAIVESVNLEGEPTLAAFDKSPQFGWTVIVGAPRGELMQTLWRLGSFASIISVLLIALGVALSFWISRPVVRSIEHLVDGANALGRGESVRTPPLELIEANAVALALRESGDRLAGREQELKRLNETLEARVKERTSELAEANRVLSIRNRELQDFAHVASHDLQEPLRGIYSFANLLHTEYKDQLDDTARFYLQRIESASDRMRQLVRDILAFSSITTDRHGRSEVDLNRVMKEVLADLGPRVNSVNGSVDYGVLPVIRADPVQMHQLLLNLVGNALKFHRPGIPPVVKITSARTADQIKIGVEDNGIGFEPSFADRIFTPFERLHGRDAYEGTGIGLAIVRRILERHGGTITATGHPGAGSRFEAILPA